MSLASIGIPKLKIRRSHDRLIFNMGIPIPGKDGLYIKMGPWILSSYLIKLEDVWLAGITISQTPFNCPNEWQLYSPADNVCNWQISGRFNGRSFQVSLFRQKMFSIACLLHKFYVFLYIILWYFFWSCNTGTAWTTVLWHQDTLSMVCNVGNWRCVFIWNVYTERFEKNICRRIRPWWLTQKNK